MTRATFVIFYQVLLTDVVVYPGELYRLLGTSSYIVLNKNWKIYWSEQSFTGLGWEGQCSSWELIYAFLWVENFSTIQY